LSTTLHKLLFSFFFKLVKQRPNTFSKAQKTD
jgi:hypothetical protein